MGMGQELRDFTQGFQTGFSIGDKSNQRKDQFALYSGFQSRKDWEDAQKIKNENPDVSGSPSSPRAPSTNDPTGTSSGAGVRSDGRSADTGDPDADRILNAIRPLEGGSKDPYNTGFGGKKIDLANMTVQQTLDNGYAGLKFPVLGAYQFKKSTLAGLVEKGYVDPNAKMNQQTQDDAAYQLLKARGFNDFKAGKLPAQNFMYNLSQEWASLPDPYKNGASHYGKNGVDKAGMSMSAFTDLLTPQTGGSTTANSQTPQAIPTPQAGTKTPQQAQQQVDTPGAPPVPVTDVQPDPNAPALPPPQTGSDIPDPDQYQYGPPADDSQSYAAGGPVTPTNADQAGSGRAYTQAIPTSPSSGGIPAGGNGWTPRQISAPPPNSAIVNPAAGAQQKFRDNLAAIQAQQAAAAAAAAKQPAAPAVDNAPFSHNSYLQAQQQYDAQHPAQINNGRDEPTQYRNPFMDESQWQSQQPGYKDWYQQNYGVPAPQGNYFTNGAMINGSTSDGSAYHYGAGGMVKSYADGGNADPTYDQSYALAPGGGPSPGYDPGNYDYSGGNMPTGPELHDMSDTEDARRRASYGVGRPARNPSKSAIPDPTPNTSELHSGAGSFPTPDDAGSKAEQKAAQDRLTKRDQEYAKLKPQQGPPQPPIGQPVDYSTPTPPAPQQGPTPPSPGSEPGGTPTPPEVDGPPMPSPGAMPGGTPTPPSPQGPPIPPAAQQQGPAQPPIGQPVDYSTPTAIPSAPQQGPPIPPQQGPPIPSAGSSPYGAGPGVKAAQVPGQIGSQAQNAPDTHTAIPIPAALMPSPAVAAQGQSPYGSGDGSDAPVAPGSMAAAPQPPVQGPPIPQAIPTPDQQASNVPTPPPRPPGQVLGGAPNTATANANDNVVVKPVVKPGKVPDHTPAIVSKDESQQSTKAALGSINKGLGASKQYVAIGPDQQANAEANANTTKFMTNQNALTGQEYNQLAQQVDPDNKLAPAEKVLKVQQDLYDFYMARGYPNKAAEAAASVLMYGRKVSQISGAMAQAALEKGDTNTAATWMAKAYETMPDGQELRIGKADAQGNIQYQLVDLETGQAGEVQTATPDDMLTMAKGMASGAEWAKQTIGIAQGSGVGVNSGARYGGRGSRVGGVSNVASQRAQDAQQKAALSGALKSAGDAYKADPSDANRQAFEAASTAASAGGVNTGAIKLTRKLYGFDNAGGSAQERLTAANDADLKKKVDATQDPNQKALLTANDGYNRALKSSKRVGNLKNVDDALSQTKLDDASKEVIKHYVPEFARANDRDAAAAVPVLTAIIQGSKVTMNGPVVSVEGYGDFYLSADQLRDLAKARQSYKAAAAKAG